MTLIRRKKQSILATFCLTAFWSVAYSQSEQGGESDPVFVSPEAQQRISELVADSRIQGSFAQIVATESQLLSDHIELTEISAPPFGEDKRAQRFAEMLREAGLSDVAVDDVGNVGEEGLGDLRGVKHLLRKDGPQIDMRSGDQAKIDQIDALLQRAVLEALVEENAARLEGPKLTVDV
jgi:hypothetical protein